MNQKIKNRVKETFGIISGITTLGFAVLGVFSLDEYITIYGSLLICLIVIGMYKYA